MKESIIIYTACCLVALIMFCWGRYVGKNITPMVELYGTISYEVLSRLGKNLRFVKEIVPAE